MPTHQHLIDCMQALGYTSNAGGVCFGLAQMTKRAILANDLVTFDLRIKKIDSLSVDDFRKIGETLKKDPDQRKFDFLKHKNVTYEDIIDFLSFFDGIELYFQKHLYAHLFQSDQNLSQSNFAIVDQLFSEKTHTGVEGIKEIISLSGIYSQSNLKQFFKMIRGLKNENGSVALCFTNGTHELCVGFDFKNKQFSFVDINQLPTRYYSDDFEELAYALGEGFGLMNAGDMALHVSLYANQTGADTVNVQLKEIQRSEPWRNMHALSDKKARITNVNGCSLLWIAAQHGDTKIVEALLKRPVDVNQANKDGMTPLYTAAENGQAAVVRQLLGVGAKVDKTRQCGEAPLLIASQNGQTAVVQMLLDAHAPVDQARIDGLTPLCAATQFRHLDVVKILLRFHAKVNQATINGTSPLWIAVYNNDLEMIEVLLQAGAAVDQKDKAGVSPLDLAKEMGYLNIVNALEQASQIASPRMRF